MFHHSFRFPLIGFLISLVAPLIHAATAAVHSVIDFAETCLQTCQVGAALILQPVKLIAFKVIEHLNPEYDASYRSAGHSIDLCSRC